MSNWTIANSTSKTSGCLSVVVIPRQNRKISFFGVCVDRACYGKSQNKSQGIDPHL